MKFLQLPKDAKFSNKAIFVFLLPIFVEQILIAAMSTADTLMISKIANSESALAAIANVSRIDVLIKQIFTALAAGGSVVVSQYIGAKRFKEANQSLKMSLYSIMAITILMSAVLMLFRNQILGSLFGTVEASVTENSLIYFTVAICYYPFMSLYNTCSAAFRAMRESKIPLIGSVAMMGINLLLKYIFIFKYDMGVFGAGLSLLFAYALTGFVLLVMLCSKHRVAFIERLFHLDFNFGMIKRIFKIGIPNGIENGLFQLGALILQVLVATMGTVAINANHLGHSLTPLMYTASSAFSLGVLTFVGQCMGAGNPDEAAFYTKHILKLQHTVLVILAAILIPSIPLLVSIFGMSEEISTTTEAILYLYFISSLFVYPSSFTLANALRGTGDARFTMIASICTMFLFRIGFAYVLAYAFNLGVMSIWIAMVMDWAIRTIIYQIRFRRGKWKKHHVI